MREENKEQYAIVDKNGVFITYPNETGSGNFISLMTKSQAEGKVKMYYNKNYKIKKMKVK
jgi:cell division septal protein FtsQ